MKILFPLTALALTGCATTTAGPIDACKGAELRRAAYTSAIVAADAYAATGRPVPAAVELGRQAAVVALGVLEARCPSTV